MASYDSDSSGGEDDYTETNVLLGFASQEPTDDTISQLGGHPSWFDNTSTPSAALARCKACNDMMSLLLQLNGDMPEHFPGHERRLYLFGCQRRTCRRKQGSVRGFRAVRLSKTQEQERTQETRPSEPQETQIQAQEEAPAPSNIGASLFGVKPPTDVSNASSNPFSASSVSASALSNPFSTKPTASGSTPSNPFSNPPSPATAAPPQPSPTASSLPETFAQRVRISLPSPPPPPSPPTTTEPWPPQSSFPTAYPSYHLDADYETLSPRAPTVPQNVRLDMDMDVDGNSNSSSNARDDKDTFESSLDTAFQRFADRIADNPTQVLRYEFRGRPLLYSTTDPVGSLLSRPSHTPANALPVPPCANCAAPRVFELQLTPHAISELEVHETGLEGMEWGTVLLGVCGRDCAPRGQEAGEVGYLEEWVGVQWEEVGGKR
ncbi:hypothetical protein LTR04_003878 [Oleoguttula sp. CCFEE 6159]|nr:hypothetical protein LTR04_003878 [Oleoguttula sp. CCFEE 6159]